VSLPSAGRRLLDWYDRERRDLPWRRRAGPWAVWVSEVMLQQTRVETVVPYYRRFLARFPSPAALAAAEEEEVLALWSGLGYYRRARLLQAGARAVVAAGVEIPQSAAELEALPGIGPYTAAAIASIAFGEAAPVLDGNVERLLARWLALDGAPKRAANRARLLEAARGLLVPGRAGDSNQAMMELGATLCLPRRPACDRCPLARDCAALASGRTAELPVRAVRRAPRRERHVAALADDGAGRLLLAHRPGTSSILPGLWELPTVVAEGAEEAASRLAARYGGRWRLDATTLGKVRHAITFRALEIALHSARWSPDGTGERGELAWVEWQEASQLALTGAARKLLRANDRRTG